MTNLKRDLYFWFFATGALLALVVSAPATYAIVSPFHSSGDRWGIGLSVAFVLLLELGAIGAKISGVNWLCVLLLIFTIFANFAAGNDHLSRASLPPTLEAWRSAGFGWVMVLIYAANVPALLYTFLHFAVKRARQILAFGRGGDSVTLEVRALAREVRALADSQALASMAREAPEVFPAATRAYVCPHCGASLSQSQYGAMVRYGRCSACPKSS